MRMNKPLKVLIVEDGRSQYEIAQAAGIQETRLSKIIHKRAQMTEVERGLLAHVLGKSADELNKTYTDAPVQASSNGKIPRRGREPADNGGSTMQEPQDYILELLRFGRPKCRFQHRVGKKIWICCRGPEHEPPHAYVKMIVTGFTDEGKKAGSITYETSHALEGKA